MRAFGTESRVRLLFALLEGELGVEQLAEVTGSEPSASLPSSSESCASCATWPLAGTGGESSIASTTITSASCWPRSAITTSTRAATGAQLGGAGAKVEAS